MIPLRLLLKMGTYEVKIQGVNVKFSVIDDACVLNAKIAEFKASYELCRFNRIPVSLSNFLKDTCIFFVIEKAENLTVGRVWFHKNLNSSMTSVVDLSELAVRVLKKPDLSTCGFAELASEVGIDVKPAGTKAPNWKSIVFSNEEIKFAILDAYTIYRIGDKLFGMVA
ncbi:hypothetical protein QYF36_001433 [Acer negundo]|nr:hypothetical protein QYF36_001433 [Acer negundo]